jgi:hypothetical protein
MTMCASSSASGSPSRSGGPGGGGCTSPADAGPVTASSSSGHPQAAAESAVDSIVRTPGRGSAALPDTGHCRSRPDGHSRTWPPLLFPHRRLGVAMPGGGRSCSSHFEWPWPAAAAVLSTASGRAPHELPCPRWLPHGPPRVRAGGWTPAVGRTLRLEPQAAGTSLAADISLADACRTPSVWTPSVRTAVVPEAADGQTAAPPELIQLPLRLLKAGPAGGLRPPSGPATTRRPPGSRPHPPHQGKPEQSRPRRLGHALDASRTATILGGRPPSAS